MFKGTQESKSGLSKFTGLDAFSIIAVNPTTREVRDILKTENYPEISYDKRDNFDGKKVRPVTFWMKGTDTVQSMNFSIGLFPNVTKSGKTQFINARGQFKYANTIEECEQNYPDFKPVRPAYEGEYELATFIQRMIRYKPLAEDAQYLKDAEQAGLDPETIFNGDYSGLKTFIENYQKNKIGLVLSVRIVKNGDDVKQKQAIITKPECYFTLLGNVIDKWHVNRLKEIVESSKTTGYPVTNDLFTIEYQKFDPENCINNIPSNPKTDDTWTF